MNFEWNIQKAASNEKDHKVTFSDAVTVFSEVISVETQPAIGRRSLASQI